MNIATHFMHLKSDNPKAPSRQLLLSILSADHCTTDDLSLVLYSDMEQFNKITDFEKDLFSTYQQQSNEETVLTTFNSNKWKNIINQSAPPLELPFDPDLNINLQHTNYEEPLVDNVSFDKLRQLLSDLCNYTK